MAEKLIITRNDIEEFFPIGKNVPNERLLQHILRAQQSDLKPFLGDAQYFDFIENFASPQNQSLYTGGSYAYQSRNIFFGGVRQLLVAWAYSRLYNENPDHLTRGGNTKKVTEESQIQEQNITNQKVTEAKSEAIRLQAETFQFLDQNRATYTLWQIGLSTNAPTLTSFKITKVRPTGLLTRGGM